MDRAYIRVTSVECYPSGIARDCKTRKVYLDSPEYQAFLKVEGQKQYLNNGCYVVQQKTDIL